MQGLEQGQRALAAIARMTGGKERGEGDSAAVVGAAGGGQGVGGLVADDADDVPSIAARGRGDNAGFKASIVDYGAGRAGCSCVERQLCKSSKGEEETHGDGLWMRS